MVHAETKIAEWYAPEYLHQRKSRGWFIALALIVISGSAISIIAQNYLMTIMIILAGIVFALLATRPPKVLHIEISAIGIKVDEEMYLYEKTEAFWISVDESHEKENYLLLAYNRPVAPIISVPINEDVDPVMLRELLLDVIPEQEIKRAFSAQTS